MNEFVLRKATQEDSSLLFEWRNDPVTREMFKNTQAITWAEHETWFNNIVDDPHFLLLMVKYQQQQIGVVRFDIHDDMAEISINIAPTFRGQKLSAGILMCACQMAFAGKNLTTLKADVKQTNSASLKAFMQAGFTIDTQDDEYYYLSLKIKSGNS